MSECKACGYKYSFDDKDFEEKERFIEIFTDQGFYESGDQNFVRLYACPKCGTVIMSKWGM